MDIYHTAKQLLNSLLQQAVEAGLSPAEIVYQVAKAADDSVKLKHSALWHKENDEEGAE